MLLTRTCSFVLATLLATAAFAADAKLNLTGENTKVEFLGTKKDGSHTGSFKKLAGAATLKGSDLTTLALDVTIDINSMVTDNDKLTAHLKSPDFFEVKKYPDAKFVSTGVKKTNDGFTVTGDFTLRGQTKSISFPAKISADGAGLKLNAKFTIDRTEWGMTYGKGNVDAKVTLTISVDARK